MIDGQQAYQWPQPYFGAEQPTRSVDSARASKSKSGEKEPKHLKGAKPQAQMPTGAALNQFVPVYMIPPGFQGHPGAFNAALAAHAASQGQTVPNMYQMPTYGHFNQGYLPYGYPAAAAPQPAKGYVAQYGSYSGSDYQTNSSVHTGSNAGDSSHRNSKSSDNSSKRNSRSTTSKDSARHSVEDGARKNSIRRLPPTKNGGPRKKYPFYLFHSSFIITSIPTSDSATHPSPRSADAVRGIRNLANRLLRLGFHSVIYLKAACQAPTHPGSPLWGL